MILRGNNEENADRNSKDSTDKYSLKIQENTILKNKNYNIKILEGLVWNRVENLLKNSNHIITNSKIKMIITEVIARFPELKFSIIYNNMMDKLVSVFC